MCDYSTLPPLESVKLVLSSVGGKKGNSHLWSNFHTKFHEEPYSHYPVITSRRRKQINEKPSIHSIVNKCVQTDIIGNEVRLGSVGLG
jgi:hypothetical protein